MNVGDCVEILVGEHAGKWAYITRIEGYRYWVKNRVIGEVQYGDGQLKQTDCGDENPDSWDDEENELADRDDDYGDLLDDDEV